MTTTKRRNTAINRLTAGFVRSVSQPGFYPDGGTLYLRVSQNKATGSTRRQWVQRLLVKGKVRDFGLGGYPLTSLAEARAEAQENRRIARKGGDPREEQRKARVPTFKEAADRCFTEIRAEWKNGKTAASWQANMQTYILPRLGGLRLDAITQGDVLAVLRAPDLWKRQSTMRKVRTRIRSVLSWGQAQGHIQVNVAGKVIDAGLRGQKRAITNHRSLPYAEMGALLRSVESSKASPQAKGLLKLIALTAVRSSEARLARWSEIDLQAHTWTIPAERMKASRAHVVPLSAAALAVLDEAKGYRNRSGLLFPSPLKGGRKPLSNMSSHKLVKDLGYGEQTTVHGLRATFRTWAADCTDADRDTMELCLAHVPASAVVQAYDRGERLEKRRALMEAWAKHCTQ